MKTTTLLTMFISATLIALPNIIKADEGDDTYSAGTLTDTGLPSPMCGGVQASVTVSDSGEVDPSDPDCDSGEFAVTSGPNYSYSIKGPGSLSGSGSSTTWTWTPDKNFDGTTNATITLTVTWSGTDCDGDSVNWTNTATDPLSITVHGIASPLTPAPFSNTSIQLPGKSGSGNSVEHVNVYEYIEHDFSGTVDPVFANEHFEFVTEGFSDCGAGNLVGSETPGGWDWDGEVGISLGDVVDFGISISYKDPAPGPQPIFTECTHLDYRIWVGDLYQRQITPVGAGFTGTDIASDYVYDGYSQFRLTGTTTNAYTHGAVTFITSNEGNYSEKFSWHSTNYMCCPNQ